MMSSLGQVAGAAVTAAVALNLTTTGEREIAKDKTRPRDRSLPLKVRTPAVTHIGSHESDSS